MTRKCVTCPPPLSVPEKHPPPPRPKPSPPPPRPPPPRPSPPPPRPSPPPPRPPPPRPSPRPPPPRPRPHPPPPRSRQLQHSPPPMPSPRPPPPKPSPPPPLPPPAIPQPTITSAQAYGPTSATATAAGAASVAWKKWRFTATAASGAALTAEVDAAIVWWYNLAADTACEPTSIWGACSLDASDLTAASAVLGRCSHRAQGRPTWPADPGEALTHPQTPSV